MKTLTTTIWATLFVAIAGPALADTATFDESMKPIVAEYTKIHTALAGDSTAGIKKSAKKIARFSKKIAAKSVTGKHAAHYKNLPKAIKKAADQLAKAKKIDASREAFKLLSRPLAMWATMSKPAGVSVIFCSMAKGSWLQHDPKNIKNPYYGKKMLKCGQVVSGAGKGHAGGHMGGKKMSGKKMSGKKMSGHMGHKH